MWSAAAVRLAPVTILDVYTVPVLYKFMALPLTARNDMVLSLVETKPGGGKGGMLAWEWQHCAGTQAKRNSI